MGHCFQYPQTDRWQWNVCLRPENLQNAVLSVSSNGSMAMEHCIGPVQAGILVSLSVSSNGSMAMELCSSSQIFRSLSVFQYPQTDRWQWNRLTNEPVKRVRGTCLIALFSQTCFC